MNKIKLTINELKWQATLSQGGFDQIACQMLHIEVTQRSTDGKTLGVFIMHKVSKHNDQFN
jgi:hypothetical protein